MNEPVILVDKDDNEVGILDRAQAEVKPDTIIRMVYVLVSDASGRILLQRRRPDIERYPNYWTVSCTGAVHPQEGYVQAAERKLKDELGLNMEVKMARKEVLRMPGRASYMTALFVGAVNDLSLSNLDVTRVQEVRWLELDEARHGYLLTPTAEQVLNWWAEHRKDFVS